jgi:hypothetical protein
MSGDRGAVNCHGDSRANASCVIDSPDASSRTAGSLVAAVAASNPLTTGLRAETFFPALRRWRINPAVTKVLPIPVPVDVMK